MRTVELRRRAKRTIDQLDGAKLQFAADFLAYVEEKGSEHATAELLGIRGFEESYRRGIKDTRAGRVIDWRKVRRDV